MSSTNPVDIVYNFIALAVIAEFDDFVYQSLKNESMKCLVDEKVTKYILKVQHTTSSLCDKEEMSREVFDSAGIARPLKISYEDRSRTNKILRCIYKGVRTFYVSFYFYFYPFIAILLTCLIPIISSFSQNQ